MMKKITIEEILKGRKKRKIKGGGYAICFDDSTLLLIFGNGRIEHITYAKIGESKQGLIFEDKKFILVDEGRTSEEMKNG